MYVLISHSLAGHHYYHYLMHYRFIYSRLFNLSFYLDVFKSANQLCVGNMYNIFNTLGFCLTEVNATLISLHFVLKLEQ